MDSEMDNKMANVQDNNVLRKCFVNVQQPADGQFFARGACLQGNRTAMPYK